MSDTPGDLDAAVEQLACASLVDAMGRLHGHRAHLLSMVGPTPDRRLFGPAATIAYLPYRDDLPQTEIGFAELFQHAVGEAPAGRVLVLSSGGYPDVWHGGGIKLSRLERHDLAGVLADGRLRDFDQLGGYGFATWCRGEATRWGGDTVMPYAADVSVEVAGVCVTPGDYVYADASGAVVIPAASLSRVLDEAHAIENHDAATIAKILPTRASNPRGPADETDRTAPASRTWCQDGKPPGAPPTPLGMPTWPSRSSRSRRRSCTRWPSPTGVWMRCFSGSVSNRPARRSTRSCSPPRWTSRTETWPSRTCSEVAHMLRSHGIIEADPSEPVHWYIRQCSVEVTTNGLAAMAPTLANGGVQPVTGERIVSATCARQVLAASPVPYPVSGRDRSPRRTPPSTTLTPVTGPSGRRHLEVRAGRRVTPHHDDTLVDGIPAGDERPGGEFCIDRYVLGTLVLNRPERIRTDEPDTMRSSRWDSSRTSQPSEPVAPSGSTI